MPYRSARPRVRALAAAAALSVVGAVLSPSSSLASGVPCGSQSAERVEAFADSWELRLQDRVFLDAFVAAAATPPDVAAEGYHDLPLAERTCLAAKVMDRLEAKYGDAGLGGAGSAEGVLFGLIFPERSGADQTSADMPPAPAPQAAALDAALAEQRATPLVSTSSTRSARQVTVEPADELPPQTPSVVAVADKATWPVMKNVLKTVPKVKGVGKPLGLYRTLIDNSTYQLCAEWGVDKISCSGPVTYGQPASLNADDADAGADVIAVVAPTAGVGSGGLRLSVDKLLTETVAPSAHVYAVFERPEANLRLLVGFDGTGRGDRLADSSSVAVTIDLLEATRNVIKAELAVTHAGAGPSSTLAFGAVTMGKKGAEINPSRVAVRFQDPVPSTLTTNVKLDFPNSVYETTVAAGSTPLVSVSAVIDTTATATRKELGVVVDRLPASTTVTVDERDDGISATYAATGLIEKIGFFDKTTPNLAVPQTYDTLSAEVLKLPAVMSLNYTEPLDIRYTASAPIAKVGGVRQNVVAGAVTSAMSAAVHDIPASVHVVGVLPTDAAPKTAMAYRADAPVRLLEAAFTGLVELDGVQETAAASANVTSVPRAIDFAYDPVAQTATWDADGPVAEIAAEVSAPYDGRDYELGATVTSIPADWTVTAREDEYSFVAGTREAPQRIGSVLLTATNHGTVDARADDPGNRALLRYDEATGDVDAALRIEAIELFEYKPTHQPDPQDPTNPAKVRDGLFARIRAGGGGAFLADADVRLVDESAPTDPVTQLAATVLLNPLPSDITVEKRPDGTIRYLGQSTNLDADLVLGRVDALADARGEAGFSSVPARGASLRDGSACDSALTVDCATALVAHVAIDGTPAELVYSPGALSPTIQVNGFTPPAGSTFGASVQLDDARNADGSIGDVLRLDTVLRGFAPQGQSFTIGPIESRSAAQGDLSTILVNFDGTAPIDPGAGAQAIVADVQAGASLAHAEVSNIPRKIVVSGFFSGSTIRIRNTQSETLRSIRALYSEVPATTLAPPPTTWQADASITKLAKSTDLIVEPTGNVPRVILNSGEAGMTVTVGVDLALLHTSGLAGRFEATLRDLGSWVLTTVDTATGKTNIRSTPPTGLIEARIPTLHLETSTTFSDAGANNGVFATMNGTLHVTIDAVRAVLSMGGIQDFTIKPGFATGLEGTFSRFHLGWESVTLALRPEKLTGQVVLKMFGGVITVTLVSVTVDLADAAELPVIVDFHTYEHGQRSIFFQRNYLAVASCDPTETEGDFDRRYFQLSQSPTAISRARNSVEVLPAPGGAAKYTIVADPYGVLPDALIDLATVLFLGVYDKGFEVRGGCTNEFDPSWGPDDSLT